MNQTLAKVLIIGIPFTFSLAWCLYWVIRLVRFRRKKKSAAQAHVTSRPPGADAPR
jgi:hypothetical protein